MIRLEADGPIVVTSNADTDDYRDRTDQEPN